MRLLVMRAAAQISWLVLAVAACGSPRSLFAVSDAGVDAIVDSGASDGDADAGEPTDLVSMCGAEPQTLADWEACYLKRYCAALVNCGEENAYRDTAECIANLDASKGGELDFEAFERARAIAGGTATLDTVAFTQCLVEVSPSKCNTAEHAPVCARRFLGTIADDQACFTDIECTSPGAQCQQPAECTESCCAGTCQPKPKLGGACTDITDGCEPGIVCGTDRTCVIGDIGSPCAKRYDCVPQAWCDNGTCAADRKIGEPCDSLLQCGGEAVCVGLMSDFNHATCGRVTHAGDACDSFCLGNLFCDTGSGVCRPLPVHGEACDGFTLCLGIDQYCNQGQCVDRPTVGQPCSGDMCQPGLYCSDELGAAKPICTARLTDGDSGCTQPSQCQSYVCGGDASASGNCQALQATCR